MVAAIDDDHAAAAIDRQPLRSVELAGAAARNAKPRHEVTQRVEDLQALIAAVSDQQAIAHQAVAEARHSADAQFVDHGVGLKILPRRGADEDRWRQHGGWLDVAGLRHWLPIDVQQMGASLLTLSPHRFYGPNNAQDLWHVKKIPPQQLEHLTGKPAELAVRAIQYSSVLCADRLAQGFGPACAERCPTGALIWGKRGDLIAIAEKRIRENPDRYVNHIYGKDDAGGTGVMYISGVPFENLGLENLGTRPIPEISEGTANIVLPGILVGAPILLGIIRAQAKRGGWEDTWPL